LELRYRRAGCSALALALVLGTVTGQASVASGDTEVLAQKALSATGVKGGLIVHLGCGDGKLTAALRASDRYLVHGLDADSENVAKARALIQSKGAYGPVSVEQFDGKSLPYADDLANVVVSENVGRTQTRFPPRFRWAHCRRRTVVPFDDQRPVTLHGQAQGAHNSDRQPLGYLREWMNAQGDEGLKTEAENAARQEPRSP